MILVSVLELRTSQQIILLRRGTLINMELSACRGTRKKTTVRKMANIMEKTGAPNLILGAMLTSLVNQESILCFLLELNTRISSHTQQLLALIHVNVLELRTSQLNTLLRRGTHSFMDLIANLGTRKKLTAKMGVCMRELTGALILISGAMLTSHVSKASKLCSLLILNTRINLLTVQSPVKIPVIASDLRICRQTILIKKDTPQIMDHHASHGTHKGTIVKMTVNTLELIGVMIHTNGATLASSVSMASTPFSSLTQNMKTLWHTQLNLAKTHASASDQRTCRQTTLSRKDITSSTELIANLGTHRRRTAKMGESMREPNGALKHMNGAMLALHVSLESTLFSLLTLSMRIL